MPVRGPTSPANTLYRAQRSTTSAPSGNFSASMNAAASTPNWQQYANQLDPDQPVSDKDPTKMSDFYGQDAVNQFKQQYAQKLKDLAGKTFPTTVDGKTYQTFDDAAKAVVQECNNEGQVHGAIGECIMTMCITSFQMGQTMMQQFASPFGDGS